MGTQTAASRPLVRALILGTVLGALWAVVARLWMRLISTEPEFTWTGTLMIIAFAAWLGLGVGLVYGTRGRGRLRWLRLLGVPGLVLFASPGLLFAPAFLLGSAMWNHAEQGWLRRLGVALGLVAVLGPTIWVWNDERINEDLAVTLPWLDQAQVGIGFVLLSLALAYGGSFLWRPVDPSLPVPETAHPALRETPIR